MIIPTFTYDTYKELYEDIVEEGVDPDSCIIVYKGQSAVGDSHANGGVAGDVQITHHYKDGHTSVSDVLFDMWVLECDYDMLTTGKEYSLSDLDINGLYRPRLLAAQLEDITIECFRDITQSIDSYVPNNEFRVLRIDFNRQSPNELKVYVDVPDPSREEPKHSIELEGITRNNSTELKCRFYSLNELIAYARSCTEIAYPSLLVDIGELYTKVLARSVWGSDKVADHSDIRNLIDTIKDKTDMFT
jgi:hypothetical protein